MSRELPPQILKVRGCWDPGSGFVPSAGDNRAGARSPGSRCGTAPRPATRSSWTRRGGRTQVSPRSGELRTFRGSPAARTALLYTQSRAPGSGSSRSGYPGYHSQRHLGGPKHPDTVGLVREQATPPCCPSPLDSPHPPNLTAQAQARPWLSYQRPMCQSWKSHAHCHPFLKPCRPSFRMTPQTADAGPFLAPEQ